MTGPLLHQSGGKSRVITSKPSGNKASPPFEIFDDEITIITAVAVKRAVKAI